MLKRDSSGEFFEDNNVYIFFGNKSFSNTSKILNSNNLLFGKQTHEAELKNINHVNNQSATTLTNSSDGLMTTSANKKIAIYTADCVPCFIYDGESLFSLHLGWRSLQKGLLEKALSLSKNSIKIFIGPHIQYDSFEVGPEVVSAFEEALEEPKSSWSKASSNSRHYISLKKIIELKASKACAQLICSDFDTYTSTAHHSYRADKATHLRNISFAFLKK